jgi:hypothetical protein
MELFLLRSFPFLAKLACRLRFLLTWDIESISVLVGITMVTNDFLCHCMIIRVLVLLILIELNSILAYVLS